MGQEIVNYDAQWAKMADEWSSADPVASSGEFLSTRGGVLSIGDQQLPGNQVCVIIVDSVRENTYFPDKFNPDNITSPVCYAFGRSEEDMAPHESMQADLDYFQPQAESCAVCPRNEKGTADVGFRKECQNRRRLTLLPAGVYVPKRGSRDFDLELFDDPDHFRTADFAYLKLPVMSVRHFQEYVAQLRVSLHKPPPAVITRIWLENHVKYQYVVRFEVVEEVPAELASVLMARSQEAASAQITGYRPPQEAEAATTGSLRGLRRGRR